MVGRFVDVVVGRFGGDLKQFAGACEASIKVTSSSRDVVARRTSTTVLVSSRQNGLLGRVSGPVVVPTSIRVHSDDFPDPYTAFSL